ncbi:hypothetical protein AGLY_009955 [Aphis glycines]|uniref:Uncharacterized protein n=1 Tax=Aphis glycines TaxID=307491 RepID=A0A6G0TI82_APHGL|nr:hypothetical protein AGLY_009955 [Aphis glycines]
MIKLKSAAIFYRAMFTKFYTMKINSLFCKHCLVGIWLHDFNFPKGMVLLYSYLENDPPLLFITPNVANFTSFKKLEELCTVLPPNIILTCGLAMFILMGIALLLILILLNLQLIPSSVEHVENTSIQCSATFFDFNICIKLVNSLLLSLLKDFKAYNITSLLASSSGIPFSISSLIFLSKYSLLVLKFTCLYKSSCSAHNNTFLRSVIQITGINSGVTGSSLRSNINNCGSSCLLIFEEAWNHEVLLLSNQHNILALLPYLGLRNSLHNKDIFSLVGRKNVIHFI